MDAKKICEQYESLHEEMAALSRYIYDHPELGNQEYQSCAAHAAFLRKHGFQVEEGFLNIPTAFWAEYKGKKPGPTICYLAEYDALPDIGHGCGHNLLGTVSSGAGVLLSRLIGQIGGRVVVGGTPAEETCGAKVAFAAQGVFDDVDVVLVSHPYDADVESGSSLALDPIQFTFTGRAAHAAAAPEQGINALDACLATFHSINALREHLLPSTRIHGIITQGGVAANIVPDRATAQFYVRTSTKSYLKEVVEKVENCARAGALATGAGLEISRFELGYDNLITNQRLQKLLTKNLNILGITDIRPADKTFGSTDVGNVSHVCPTVHNCYNIFAPGEERYPTHTAEFREATLRPAALEAMRKNTCALAMSGAEIIQSPQLLSEIKAEFKQSV